MQRTYHIKQFLSFVLKERFHPRADARGPQLKFDSQFGDYAKVAGRDINETINNLRTEMAKLHGNFTNYIGKIENALTEKESKNDFLFNTVYERGGVRMIQGIETVISRWESEGWKLKDISSDYGGIDGILLLFTRPAQTDINRFFFYHSSDMNEEYRSS